MKDYDKNNDIIISDQVIGYHASKALEETSNKESSMENKSDVKSELSPFKEVMINAIPATMGLLFIFLVETINIIFIGRLNDAELISAIGLGTLYVNSTGFVIGLGLIGGIDTLCSQSYGAKEYKLMGIYMNIGRITVIMFFVILFLPFVIFCDTLLLAIGQTEEFAYICSKFAYSMIPSIFFALMYNVSVRYLQSMQIFLPGMLITLFTAIIHSLWCYIFIHLLSLDVIGAGIAIGITQFLNFLMITIYINVKNPCPESNCSMTLESFDYAMILDYLMLAIPSTLLMAADWLGFEVLTLMSSYLGNISLAANVVLFNFISIIFMISLGISFAVTALVGNAMGSKNVQNAKKYSCVAILTGVCIVSITTSLVIIFREAIPYVYTSDERVADLVKQLLDVYVFFSILDSIQIVEHGIVKGLGQQRNASICAFIILYPVNISNAYYLGFVLKYGVVGLWYSQLCSVVLLAFCYFIILFYCDWDKVSLDCVEKFNEERMDIELKSRKTN